MRNQIRLLMPLLILFLSIGSMAQKAKTDFKTKSLIELAEERRTKPLSEFNADEKKLMKLERYLLQLFQEGNIDLAMSYLTEDAMVNPPAMEAIFGRENQKQLFKQLLAMEGVELSWEPIEATVSPAGEMGYVYGVVKWKMPNEPESFGKYISIWVKENGKWMNQVEMRNSIQ